MKENDSLERILAEHGGLLPPTITAKDWPRRVLEEAFADHYRRGQTPAVEEPQASNGTLIQFLAENHHDDRRSELLSWYGSMVSNKAYALSDMILIAKSASQSEADLSVFKSFLLSFIGSFGTTNRERIPHVFGQFLDLVAPFPEKVAFSWGFINTCLKKRPSLYWSSDSLHRIYVGLLTKFCTPNIGRDVRFELIPMLQRVIRRIMDAHDARYLTLVSQAFDVADGMKLWNDPPELHEFTGLLGWARARLDVLKTEQHGIQLQRLKVFVGKKTSMAFDEVLNVVLGVEFSRARIEVGNGLWEYLYSVKVKLDVPGFIKDSDAGREWLRIRSGLRIKIEVDCPTDPNYYLCINHGFTDVATSSWIESVASHTTTSRHDRLMLSLWSADGEVIFNGLTVYLSQKDIPELIPPFGTVTETE